MTHPPRSDVAAVVIGTLVPDTPEYHGPAFNRAGQMFQAGLIGGLLRAGLPVTQVLSVEPVPAFPRARRFFSRRGAAPLSSAGLAVRFIPFVNVQPLKALTAGVSVAVKLVAWAWRHRGRRRLVHLFNMTMPPGLFVWLAARLTGSHVTVSTMDVWRPGGLVPDTLPWRIDFAMQSALLPRFDGHMVVSRAIADDLLPGRRVCIIEGAIAAGKFVRPAPPSAGGRPFRVVLSGSLADFNGVDLVLDAMDHLPDDVVLVVAGAGPLAAKVRERAARDRRIVYLGFVSFDEVLDAYASADLLLNTRITTAIDTSYFFPSKLMELLASGTPVLSTCTGHVESEYGHVLFLLREETPAALARRILEIRAIDPAERAALGQRAHEFMLREKTWDRQGERFVRYLYDHVLQAVPA